MARDDDRIRSIATRGVLPPNAKRLIVRGYNDEPTADYDEIRIERRDGPNGFYLVVEAYCGDSTPFASKTIADDSDFEDVVRALREVLSNA